MNKTHSEIRNTFFYQFSFYVGIKMSNNITLINREAPLTTITFVIMKHDNCGAFWLFSVFGRNSFRTLLIFTETS